MKHLSIIIFLFFVVKMDLYCQERNFNNVNSDILEYFSEMGKNQSVFLNNYESDYFNEVFKSSRNEFDFTDKKVGFIKGSNAGKISNKKEYFDCEKKRYANDLSITNSQIYIFNKEEKVQSGGYDAVIVSWSKVVVSHKSLVKMLRNNEE